MHRCSKGNHGFSLAAPFEPRMRGLQREACSLQTSSLMLPIRKSNVRRNHAVGAEVRVPDLGLAFGALAASIRPTSLFLTTFQELPVGTSVIVELSLPDGPAVVDGIVAHADDPAGLGLAIELVVADDDTRGRLGAASSMIPPAHASEVKVA